LPNRSLKEKNPNKVLNFKLFIVFLERCVNDFYKNNPSDSAKETFELEK